MQHTLSIKTISIKTFSLVLGIILPVCLFAQPIRWGDSTYNKIIANECEGKLFFKTEELPHFTITKQAFEDSLTTYLTSRNAMPVSKKVEFIFVLTKQGQMIDYSMLAYDTPHPDIVSEAFLHFSGLWVAAVQNHHAVCSSVKCELAFKGDKLMATIKQ